MKRALLTRAAFVFAGLLLLISGFTFLAQADLTSSITVDVAFPTVTVPSGTMVGGIGQQHVFRLGSSAPTGQFAGLDPKAGTTPSGGTIAFLFPSTDPTGNFQTSRNAIGFNDFVYAIRITNSASNVALDTILTGLCAGHTITSIGFVQMATNRNPTNFIELATGLDYFFGGNQAIMPAESSAILFYTSPDPPQRQPASIGSSGVTSQGIQPGNPANLTPIYGACPARIVVEKRIGCSAQGPFTDGPQSALDGAPVFYQITVRNTGMTPLDNVVITDPNLRANGGNLTADFPFTVPQHLEPGESVTQVFGPFTATADQGVPGVSVNGTNTATATADYLIPDQQGVPIQDQTFQVLGSDDVVLNVVTPGIQCNKAVDPLVFSSFPTTLNYTLKTTNTGNTDLAITIDDPKLRAIINNPPAGVTVNQVQIHSEAGFASGNLTSGNLPATFSVVDGVSGTNTMAQVDITLTITSFAGFQALADDPSAATISNTMSATGTVTNFNGCLNGNSSTVNCISPAVASFNPPCSIALTKQVACNSSGNFASTATSLRNAALTYRYVVTNTGFDKLNDVVINDNQISSPLFNVGMLLPGESRTVDVAANAPNTAGPFTNTASATGSCLFGNRSVTSTQVMATVTVLDPQVNCTKLVNGVTNLPNYIAGQPLTYTLTASNAASSGANLDITLSDPLLSSLPGISCKLADNTSVTLPFMFPNVPPGGSRTITCTVSFPTADAFKAAAGGSLTLNNTLTASGVLSNGSQICTSGANPPPPFLCSSTASVTVVPRPQLLLTKEVACASPSLDCNNGSFQTTTPANPLKVLASQDGTMRGAVVYRYRVTNAGDITVNNININDDRIGTLMVGTLAPGQQSSFICSAPFTPPVGVTTNIAQAIGTSAMSQTTGNVTSNQATAVVEVQQPSLVCLLKSTACNRAGDQVTVTLTLTNGPVPITVNSISGLPGTLNPAPPFDLAPNETKTLTTTFNTASASATFTVTVNGTVKTNGFCSVKADGTAVGTAVSATCSLTISCGGKCDTICFKPPTQCQIFLNKLPSGTIVIGGVNFNNPIDIQTNGPAIQRALNPCVTGISCRLTPLQRLNQGYVAAQLSLAAHGGGTNSPIALNVLWGRLGCYPKLTNFAPVTLSNGVTLTPNSMVKDLFEQARKAIQQNRTADFIPLAQLFELLNSCA